MPDLSASLRKRDLGFLRIVAGFWGVELESRETESAVEELCAALLDVEAARETVTILPSEPRAALEALLQAGGKMEWALFARRFGEIREMGAARRDRERPHLKPVSPAETLFYRALLDKAFFETEAGAQEFAYLPEDLLEVLAAGTEQARAENARKEQPLGRGATPLEKACEIPADDFILDDATTYLAALRMSLEPEGLPVAALRSLLIAARILDKTGEPQPEAVKKFLEAPRADALNALYQAWLDSDSFNELRLIPTLQCEGEWSNQPRAARAFLLNLLRDLPPGKWWSLPAFLRDLKTKRPDFQRPAGDYDSWFIKRASDGQYLRGFAYWDQVDGALVRYVIQTLHWLGRADLAAPEAGKEFTAFRLREAAPLPSGEGILTVSSNGKLLISRNFSRAARYQAARFCEWEGEKNGEYLYRLSARSLARAQRQGLKAEQLLAILAKHARGGVPPALTKALKRWDANGVEARVENRPILRVASPEILDALRKSKAQKFLGETLSPTAVILKRGAESKVTETLAELGVFAEVKEEG